MSPTEIRACVNKADNEINSISLLLFNALSRANALREGSKVYENPAACNEMDALCQYINSAHGALGEVADYNREFETEADAIEAEATKSSSDDLDQLVEQVKAAMAGADPGTDVVFVVRKEDSAESTTLDEYQNEAFKRYSEALHDKREAELRLQRRKGLFT